MVDFNKLLQEFKDQTPEQRQAAADARQAEFDREISQGLQRRRHLAARMPALERLTDFERRFAQDMARRADRDDPGTGLVGGALLSLTDPQLKVFESLAARVENPNSHADTPTASMHPRARFMGGCH